jgi:MFS transporter, DHA2 family, multidrug resistance protein
MAIQVTPTRAGAREWAGLAVLALPTLLLALDNSVLFLALPHLGESLRPTSTQLLWIMDSYGFLIAGFLITMGTLGDRIGRRRLLMIGAAAFGVASALAAYAPSAEALIVLRALLGVAGATLMPSTLALIGDLFADARQRSLAIGVWASCFMAGAALGPVVGGVLLEHFWWGSVFLMGVPVIALTLLLAPVLLPESRSAAAGRLEPVSVLLSLAALLPVIYGLKELAKGAAPLVPGTALVAGLGFGALFVARQRRLPAPLLDLSLFGRRAFSGALVMLLAGMAVTGGLYLVISQYLQLVADLPPLDAGLWLVPGALAVVLSSLASPVLARRFRPGLVVAAGLAVSAVGYLVLTFADGAGLTVPMIGFVIGMLGIGPLNSLGIELVVSSAPAERAGGASATAETGGELGHALGIAAFGSLAAAVYTGQLTVPAGTPEPARAAATESIDGASAAAAELPGSGEALLTAARDAFSAGVATVAGVCAALITVLAVVAVALLRHVRPTRASDVSE